MDYTQLDWESTGNECVFAMARDNDDKNLWWGAVGQWLDGGDEQGRQYLALIAQVDVRDYFESGLNLMDDWSRAEDLLNEITDPNIVEEFGYFHKYSEACQEVLSHIGEVRNLSESAIRDYC